MREFKFFKGNKETTPTLYVVPGINFNNIAGELVTAASDLQDRIRTLEEEVTYLRNHVHQSLYNEIESL
jgi:hypothetical protein